MKKTFWIWFAVMCVVAAVVSPACAGWGKCVGCHFGAIAPSKEALKKKFTTLDEFVKGALAAKSSMMDGIKKDPDNIRKVAKEIGYAEPGQKAQ